MSRYGHIPHNFFEGLLNKMGGEERAQAFLRNELTLVETPKKWRVDAEGIIYFSVTSDGTEGEAWITRLESKGIHTGCYTKQVLRSPDFKPTNGVTTEVAVLPGRLFEHDNRIISSICAEAGKRKLKKSSIELACLIREKFTNKEIEAMDLVWIVVMHESIYVSDDNPRLLFVNRNNTSPWLNACSGRPSDECDRNNGFAFAVSSAPADKQVCS